MDAAPPVQQGRSSFSSILMMCLILYLLTRSDIDPLAQSRLYDVLTAAQHLQGNYSAWLNGTQSNYTEVKPPASLTPLAQAVLPPRVVIDPSRQSFWGNLTGFWNGAAGFYNLSNAATLPPGWASLGKELVKSMNETEVLERTSTWNWTEIHKAGFRINDMDSENNPLIQVVAGHLDLEHKNGLMKFQFEGLRFPQEGAFYALATPHGYDADVRDIPPMVPESWRNASRYVIEAHLKKKVKELQRKVDLGMGDDDSSDENTDTLCEFFFYGEVLPSPINALHMKELEQELSRPTGISTVARPPAQLKGVLISTNCAAVVELKQMEGLRVDHFWHKVTTYSGLASLLYLGLLLLLVREMEATRTPAGISAVSRWSFVFQAVMDGFSFTSHVMFGVLTKNRASMSMIAPGFLACILAMMFEVRFTSLIHRIQAPEDATALAARPVPTQPTPNPPASTNSPPDAVVPPPPPPPSPLLRLRRILNAVTDPDAKFWVFLLFLFIFLLQFTISTSFILGSITVFHSFWLPQIARNVNRGTRKALSKRYTVGTSVLRALLLLYAFACPDNILLIDTSSTSYLVVAWIALQVLILIGQEYLGASFFIPKGWVTMPDVYDYHPNLIADTEAPEQNLGDCAICMEPIIVRPEGSTQPSGEKFEPGHTQSSSVGSGASLLLNVGIRRHYAFTPCSHIMHTACLETWMRVKRTTGVSSQPLKVTSRGVLVVQVKGSVGLKPKVK
ncbi:hypothetical protein FRB99_007262 [Tulasnella sp. 403]|nr:hypothetical protein FRB99_007262 [Tulasnella sp. 403]